MNKRHCDGCSVCCEGYLRGSAFGNIFDSTTSCIYLKDKKCSIYEYRPNPCRTYYCAWLQGLFTDSLFPPTCGFTVSIEFDTQEKQYLKIIPTESNINIDEVKEFCQHHNTYYVLVGDQENEN